MNARTNSVIDVGMDGVLIDVECQISKGLPNMVIVGIASKAVDESKERIRSAFQNNDLNIPKRRITINLAPADIPKEGTSLDLAIAASILNASEQVKNIKSSVYIGELGLDGMVRPVRGIIGKLLKAKELGFKNCFIPFDNLQQAEVISGITIYPVKYLKDLYLHLGGALLIKSSGYKSIAQSINSTTKVPVDMSDIAGQTSAKRALEIAAAGGHNVLLSGPPGTGKSMLAKAFRGIMPAMNEQEMLEVTHIHSLSGRNYDSIISTRPFRTPHHTSSNTAIVGGGQNPRPGEISLSHRGVLFLDELPEFNRTAIEALRQPLEDRTITIARARGSLEFPAHFTLIATANPCPCGFYGTDTECECPASLIANYQRKLSGPIMDRIDLFVEVNEVDHKELLQSKQNGSTSNTIQNRVTCARNIQKSRFKNELTTNSDMDNKLLKTVALLSPEATNLLNTASQRLKISARGYMRIIRVARTIADLDEATAIEINHVSEALQYRRKNLSSTSILSM